MNEKADRILANQNEAIEKAAQSMWHDEFARVVIEQFARNSTLTLEDLRRALEARLADDSTDRIAKAKCRGALEALRA